MRLHLALRQPEKSAAEQCQDIFAAELKLRETYMDGKRRLARTDAESGEAAFLALLSGEPAPASNRAENLESIETAKAGQRSARAARWKRLLDVNAEESAAHVEEADRIGAELAEHLAKVHAARAVLEELEGGVPFEPVRSQLNPNTLGSADGRPLPRPGTDEYRRLFNITPPKSELLGEPGGRIAAVGTASCRASRDRQRLLRGRQHRKTHCGRMR